MLVEVDRFFGFNEEVRVFINLTYLMLLIFCEEFKSFLAVIMFILGVSSLDILLFSFKDLSLLLNDLFFDSYLGVTGWAGDASFFV